MTDYKLVTREEAIESFKEWGAGKSWDIVQRLLSERDAYREVAFCRFNDLDDATVYAHVDAEAARIMEGK